MMGSNKIAIEPYGKMIGSRGDGKIVLLGQTGITPRVHDVRLEKVVVERKLEFVPEPKEAEKH
jgi:hypothetical protein